jgi:ribokinase
VTLDRLPAHDEKVIGQFVGYMPGGPASNFACAASQLGLRAAVLASVGEDEAGRRIVDDFARFGVDTSFLEVVAGGISNFTVCLIDPTGEKAVVVVPMLDEGYSLELARQVLPQCRLLFVMPNDGGRFHQLAQIAQRCGTEVMIDVEASVVPDPPDLACFLDGVDIAAFNRDSFLAATGEEPTIAAARSLLAHGPRLVIVTLSAQGSLAVTPEEAAEAPAFPIEVVDTTGASDTFNAAFVRAMFAGRPLRDRLRYANAAAALAVTALGARGRLPTDAEVAAFLATLA